MSRENVETVRRAITAGFMSEPPDVQTLREVLDADAILTTDWGVGGTEHRGVQGTLAALAEMSAIWDSWQQEVERVLDAGDKGVVALLHFRAKGRESAVPVESPWAMVMTLRNGRIVTSTVFLTHAEALKAAGLEEWAASTRGAHPQPPAQGSGGEPPLKGPDIEPSSGQT